jgi:dTDP-4-amino-4,6-dideoxygalactose transaminase
LTSTSLIALNDFRRLWDDVGQEALASMERVGASGWYVLGAEVAEFERELAGFCRRRFTVGCGSGLDAIEIGLRALSLTPGERVLTTPLSAFATTLAIVRAGGVPVFVDVDACGLLDLELAEKCLADRTDIRHCVPVHLYGRTLDLEVLRQLRERFDLRIVEDCAQAIGAPVGDRAVGDAGQLAALSFYPTKNLGALGDAGAVLTDVEDLREACYALRDYGQTAKYEHSVCGLNSRLDEIHAAVLRSAFLRRLDGWNARRRVIAQAYLEGITHPGVAALPPTEACNWHLFPVRVDPARRADFQRHLATVGIQTGIHYPGLITGQPALARTSFEVHGTLERALALADSEVSLPIHPYLTDDEVGRVIRAVNAWGPS